MLLKFTKMHGLGNDFVVVDCLEDPGLDFTALAPQWSDRRFGVGFDQMLLLRPSEQADFKMEIINADGSLVEMCGNGIRCVAKYLVDHGLTQKQELAIETLAGIIRPKLLGDLVQVDMGEPVLEAEKIPTLFPHRVVEEPLVVAGEKILITAVSMGNPHCVIFVDSVADFPVQSMGSVIERHENFPNRVNVEFVQVEDPTHLKMRVWERGAGETLACGTGACATLVAAVLTGRAAREATVKLQGGDLKICWSQQDNHVYMTGPAVEVFSGTLKL